MVLSELHLLQTYSQVLKLVRKQRRILDQMITPAESKEKQQTSNDIDIPNEHQFPNSDGVEVLEKIDEPSSGVEYGNTEDEGGTFIEIVSDSSIKKLKSSMETVGKEKQEYLELKVAAELVENSTINSVNSVHITSSMISNWDVGVPLETKNCEEKNVDDNEHRVFDKSFQRKETQLLLRLAYKKQNLIPFSYHSSLVTNEDEKPPSVVKLVEEPWREDIIYGVSSNMLDGKPKGKVEIQGANDASSRKMDMVYVESSFTVGDVDSNASKPRKIYEGTELERESANAGNDANPSYDKMLSVDAHLFICVPKVPVMCSYFQFGHSVHFAILKMGIGGNFVSCHYTKCTQNWFSCEVFDEILSGKLIYGTVMRAHCAWMAEIKKGFWHSMLVLAEAWDVHDFKLLDTEPRSLNSITIEAVVMFDKIFAEMLHKGMVPDLVIISSSTWKGESEKKLQLSMFALTGGLFLCDFKFSSYGCWIFLLYVHSQVHVVEDFFRNVINVWNHNLDMRHLLVQSKKQSICARVTRLNFGKDCGMYKCTMRNTGQDTMICKILDSGQGVLCSRQSKWKSFYPTLKCLLAVEINLMKEIGYEVVFYGNNIHFSGDAVGVKMVMGCIVLCNQEGVVLQVTWMIWVVSSTARGQQQVEVFIWLFELSVYSSFIVILFLSLYSLLNMIGFAKQKYANDILKLSEERVESVVKANGITHVGLPMAYTHFTTVAISGVDVVEDKVLADIHITETHESNSRVILIIEVPYIVSEDLDCYIRVIMEFIKHSKIRGCCPVKEVPKGILVDYVETQNVKKATLESILKRTLQHYMSSAIGKALKDSINTGTKFSGMENPYLSLNYLGSMWRESKINASLAKDDSRLTSTRAHYNVIDLAQDEFPGVFLKHSNGETLLPLHEIEEAYEMEISEAVGQVISLIARLIEFYALLGKCIQEQKFLSDSNDHSWRKVCLVICCMCTKNEDARPRLPGGVLVLLGQKYKEDITLVLFLFFSGVLLLKIRRATLLEVVHWLSTLLNYHSSKLDELLLYHHMPISINVRDCLSLVHLAKLSSLHLQTVDLLHCSELAAY